MVGHVPFINVTQGIHSLQLSDQVCGVEIRRSKHLDREVLKSSCRECGEWRLGVYFLNSKIYTEWSHLGVYAEIMFRGMHLSS